jgi:hypothetical protein
MDWTTRMTDADNMTIWQAVTVTIALVTAGYTTRAQARLCHRQDALQDALRHP